MITLLWAKSDIRASGRAIYTPRFLLCSRQYQHCRRAVTGKRYLQQDVLIMLLCWMLLLADCRYY